MSNVLVLLLCGRPALNRRQRCNDLEEHLDTRAVLSKDETDVKARIITSRETDLCLPEQRRAQNVRKQGLFLKCS